MRELSSQNSLIHLLMKFMMQSVLSRTATYTSSYTNNTNARTHWLAGDMTLPCAFAFYFCHTTIASGESSCCFLGRISSRTKRIFFRFQQVVESAGIFIIFAKWKGENGDFYCFSGPAICSSIPPVVHLSLFYKF